MIGMLVVLGMLISVARRPSTWKWLAPGGRDEEAAGTSSCGDESNVLKEDVRAEATPNVANAAESSPSALDPAENVVAGANDLNPDEMEEAEYEFQAISDKEPLGAEEMPSYWRLLRWSRSQSLAELKRRAKRDVRYSELFEQPDKYRGRLFQVRMHVRQVIEYDAPANRQGLKKVYEARGPSDESKTFPYAVVFDELPPGMPVGTKVQEEATFVGYFLKTWPYTDGLGVRRAAPLLFGRLEWHGVAAPAAADESGDFWQTIGVGAAVLLLLVGAWGWRFVSRRGGSVRDGRRAATADGNTTDVEAWLRAVESIETEEEQACRHNS
jgi:hypothetical protein